MKLKLLAGIVGVGLISPFSFSASLLAQYEFEENLGDSVGVNHGTAVGSISYTGGLFGKALNVGASDQGVDLGISTTVQPTGPFSVSLWVKAFESNNNRRYLGCSDGTGFIKDGWILKGQDLDGNPATRAFFDSSEDGGATIGNSWATGRPLYETDGSTWRLMVFSYDNSGGNDNSVVRFINIDITINSSQITANDVSVFSQSNESMDASVYNPTNFNTYIAAKSGAIGLYDDVRFWDAALTDSEIAELYNNGFAAFHSTTPPSSLGWHQLGTDIDGEAAGDFSGEAVSLSADGNRLAIGASANDGNGNSSGHVRIFEYIGGGWGWIQLGADIDGETAGDYSGRAVSLSSDGNRVAIGAHGIYTHSSGYVRIFEYSSGSWSQLGADIEDEAAGDRGGGSVSLSGDGYRVAIGATLNDGNGISSGHVRIFEYLGNEWVQLGSDIDGEATNDLSGRSVSLSADGSRVAVGASANDGNGDDSGHVRIFEYSAGEWAQLGADIDGESADDQSGWSVSLSADGTRVAVGAFHNDGNGSDSGHVRIFEFSGGDWTQLGADIDGETPGDLSGTSVSLSADGDRVAIGANFNNGNGYLSGHVRIFEYLSGNWIQLGADIEGEADSDYSGGATSLSADGSRLAIGAIGNDGNGSLAGHVRIYEGFLRDDLLALPLDSFISIGHEDGPFTPASKVYTLTNSGISSLSWKARWGSSWIKVSPTNGTLAVGEAANVLVSVADPASVLPADTYSDIVSFDNLATGIGPSRGLQLEVLPPLFVHTVFVDPSRPDDSGYGTSWRTAKKTIQAAVDSVDAGGTVWVTNGMFSPSANITIEKNIMVRSVNGASFTVVDGGGGHRCFYLGNNFCTLSGFTITNGYSYGDGGGVYCASDAPVIANCTISGNYAGDDGGGMYYGTASNCTFTGNSVGRYGSGGGMSKGIANNCTFTSNSVGYSGSGGGMSCGIANSCVFIGNLASSSESTGGGMTASTANTCTFVANLAVSGGGMAGGNAYGCTFVSNSASFFGGGMLVGTAYDCIFEQNTSGAWAGGGGMYEGSAYNSIFRNNTAVDGGGMSGGNQGSFAYNCLFVGNSADQYGGGLYHGNAFNCTIVSNSAGSLYYGGGGGMIGGSATNCIVWYNTAEDVDNNMASVTASHTCSPDVYPSSFTGNINDEPMFVDMNRHDFHLHTNSPCIDAGDNDCVLTETDLDGNPRVIGVAVDMGVYESEHGVSPCDLVVSNGSGSGTYMPGEMIPVMADSFPFEKAFVEWMIVPEQFTNNLFDSHAEVTTFTMPSSNVVLTATYRSLATFYVAPDGNDSNDGSSWENAKATIQGGVDIAGKYDTVIVDDGHYFLSSQVSVQKNIIVRSRNGADATTVDGQNTVRCFSLGANTCFLEGFTITNGRVNGDGGGIYCANSVPQVNNCVFINNSTPNLYDRGGGMYSGAANNCIFKDNSAAYVGGGKYSGSARNCLFTGNSAAVGGGMLDGTANNCTFVNNSALNWGGGMDGGHANNCIAWYNTAYDSADFNNTTVRCSSSPGLIHAVDGNITNVPLFVDKENGDFHLQSGSLCINAGSNVYVVGTTDLSGNPRVINSIVDMGAYEYISPSPDGDADNDGIPDWWETRYFGGITNSIATMDSDGDGPNNLQEYLFGTNPTNSLDAHVLQLKAGKLDLRSLEKRWYTLEGSDDLIDPNWTALGRFFGSGSNLTLIDPDTALFDRQYYRVRADVMSNDPATFDTDGDGQNDLNDPYPFSKDSDGDGMPDDWELDNSLSISVSNTVSDSDGDGYSDYSEYVFGTLPNNPTSQLYWACSNEVANGQIQATFNVGTASGRVYWVDFRPALTAPWQPLKRWGGDGETNSFGLTLPAGDSGYFRIRASNGNVLELQGGE